MKYLKVMFGLNSGASDLKYKLDEVNISDLWNPDETDPKKMGGFNFSTENKILRWLIRGDTVYDVSFPKDTEILDCPNGSTPHGVFRSNKIIISNPRKVTDELAMEFYLKSDIPEKSYYKSMAGCVIRGYVKTADAIIKDKVDSSNIDLVISEYEDFCKPNDCKEFNPSIHLSGNTEIFYNKLLKIKKDN